MADIKQDALAQAEALLLHPVTVVVIHKPTNKTANSTVSIRDCRKFFEAAVQSFRNNEALEECSGCTDPRSEGTHQGQTKQHPSYDSDFIAVQIDWDSKTVVTSEL